MTVVDIYGEHDVQDVETLVNLLRQQTPRGNAFSIYVSDEEFPMLSIVTKGQFARLDFFGDADVIAWASVSDKVDAKPSSMMRFALSSMPADDIAVSMDSVVSLTQAVDAAKEFFETKERPECIGWREC